MSNPGTTSVIAVKGRAFRTSGFDATKLKDGDVVLVEVKIRDSGVDRDGDIRLDMGAGVTYAKPENIAGLAERPLAVGDSITPIENPGDARELLGIVSVKGVDYALFEPFSLSLGSAGHLTAQRLDKYRRAE